MGRAQYLEWYPVSRNISAPLLSTGHCTLAFNDAHCISILKEMSGQQAEVNLLSRCGREEIETQDLHKLKDWWCGGFDTYLCDFCICKSHKT